MPKKFSTNFYRKITKSIDAILYFVPVPLQLKIAILTLSMFNVVYFLLHFYINSIRLDYFTSDLIFKWILRILWEKFPIN